MNTRNGPEQGPRDGTTDGQCQVVGPCHDGSSRGYLKFSQCNEGWPSFGSPEMNLTVVDDSMPAPLRVGIDAEKSYCEMTLLCLHAADRLVWNGK
jgi:hypothetical protein